MKTESFIALVSFKDATGEYLAGKKIRLPAETDIDRQEIATLLNYGVVKRAGAGE